MLVVTGEVLGRTLERIARSFERFLFLNNIFTDVTDMLYDG
jgi:hypothetical protein